MAAAVSFRDQLPGERIFEPARLYARPVGPGTSKLAASPIEQIASTIRLPQKLLSGRSGRLDLKAANDFPGDARNSFFRPGG